MSNTGFNKEAASAAIRRQAEEKARAELLERRQQEVLKQQQLERDMAELVQLQNELSRIFYNFQSQIALNGYRNAIETSWAQLRIFNNKVLGHGFLPDYFQGWKVDKANTHGYGAVWRFVDIYITSELLISRSEETKETYGDSTETVIHDIAYNPSEKIVQHYYNDPSIQRHSYTNNYMYGNSDVEALPCLRIMLECISFPTIVRSNQRDFENRLAETERREKSKQRNYENRLAETKRREKNMKRHDQITAILLGLSYLMLPLFIIGSIATGSESVSKVLMFVGIAFSSFAAFLYRFREGFFDMFSAIPFGIAIAGALITIPATGLVGPASFAAGVGVAFVVKWRLKQSE